MTHSRDGKSFSISEVQALLKRLKSVAIQDVIVDKKDHNTWHGSTETGVAITHDAGKTWEVNNNGLYIPRVNAFFTSRYSSEIYISTPAGVYISNDSGETWNETALILNDGEPGAGSLRAEIGGAGYLQAYWMARYHNFIDDKEVQKEWWK